MTAVGTQETVSAAAKGSAYRGAADDIHSQRVRLSMTHGGMIPRGARFLRMVILRSPEISANLSAGFLVADSHTAPRRELRQPCRLAHIQRLRAAAIR